MMFDKLKSAEGRYEQISNMLSEPDVINDNDRYKALMKEYKGLTPIVDKYREYTAAKVGEEEAKELLDGGGLEKDFREMVEEELRDC
ncbi:MAG: PCRF domain-containing protein, partial [Angelakisella sp.]